MQVRNHMTTKVFTLKADMKLISVPDIMNWAHVRHIPIVDKEHRLVGIVTHRDLLDASISSMQDDVTQAERDRFLGKILIEKVMHAPVCTIDPDGTVQEAARLMREGKIGCIVVVDQETILGIITQYDLLQVVADMEDPQPGTGSPPVDTPAAVLEFPDDVRYT